MSMFVVLCHQNLEQFLGQNTCSNTFAYKDNSLSLLLTLGSAKYLKDMKEKQILFQKGINWPATLTNNIFSDLSNSRVLHMKWKVFFKGPQKNYCTKGSIASTGIFIRSM